MDAAPQLVGVVADRVEGSINPGGVHARPTDTKASIEDLQHSVSVRLCRGGVDDEGCLCHIVQIKDAESVEHGSCGVIGLGLGSVQESDHGGHGALDVDDLFGVGVPRAVTAEDEAASIIGRNKDDESLGIGALALEGERLLESVVEVLQLSDDCSNIIVSRSCSQASVENGEGHSLLLSLGIELELLESGFGQLSQGGALLTIACLLSAIDSKGELLTSKNTENRPLRSGLSGVFATVVGANNLVDRHSVPVKVLFHGLQSLDNLVAASKEKIEANLGQDLIRNENSLVWRARVRQPRGDDGSRDQAVCHNTSSTAISHRGLQERAAGLQAARGRGHDAHKLIIREDTARN